MALSHFCQVVQVLSAEKMFGKNEVIKNVNNIKSEERLLTWHYLTSAGPGWRLWKYIFFWDLTLSKLCQVCLALVKQARVDCLLLIFRIIKSLQFFADAHAGSNLLLRKYRFSILLIVGWPSFKLYLLKYRGSPNF